MFGFRRRASRYDLVSGQEHLTQAVEMAARGEHVIIAPTHVRRFKAKYWVPPIPVISSIPGNNDAYPLISMLKDQGLAFRYVVRSDCDVPGDFPLGKHIYAVGTRLVKFTQGLLFDNPISLNLDQDYNSDGVAKSIRNLFKEGKATLKEQSLLIYPFGNWFLPGEESFDPAVVMAEAGTAFIHPSDRKAYHASVKRGAAQMAIVNKVPMLPIYSTYKEGGWRFSVGELISTAGRDPMEVTQDWLDVQRGMQVKI